MSGHGPEWEVFRKASEAKLEPHFVSPNSMAFMFETCFLMKLTPYAALEHPKDETYRDCWQQLPRLFKKP